MTDKYDETAERIWEKLGPKHGIIAPESYIRDIAEALRAAVAEEREACAEIAAQTGGCAERILARGESS